MNELDKVVLNINLSNNESQFFHLYKNENKINHFKDRMKNDINNLKLKRRQNNFDLNRALAASEEEDKTENNCFYRKVNKSKNKWGNLMMLAEWFMLIPESFYDEYLMKFCPFGKHVILVSQQKSTKVYNKNGILLYCFKSSLPGGGIDDSDCYSTINKCSIFDCIYDNDNKKIYFLDIIYFLRQDFRDMTAADRFNWLENYLNIEMTNNVQSSSNFTFEVISPVSCQKDNLKNTFLNSTPFPIDGLLFYSKDGNYTSGSTYSTMWLKPYMAPELLSVDVHPDYMLNIPMDYANYRDDIIQYNEKFGWKEPLNESVFDGDKKME